MSLLPFENSPDNLFSFSGSVGRFGDNNRDDVIKAQALLANAGYYDLPAPGMPTGWPGGELNNALTRFQKDHGLDPDGTLLPLGFGGVTETGVGETAQALKLQLFDRPQRFAPPTVAEVDRFYRGRRPGEPEPATNVVLKSADSSSDQPIGVKPVVMSDEPSADYDLKPGQQEARAPGIRPSQPPRLQPVRPPVLPDPPMAPRPEAAPPQHGPFPQPAPGERIPDEWLSERSTIKRLQEPNPYAPKQDTTPTQDDTPQRGRIIIAEDGKELHVPPLGNWADELSPEDRQIADTLNDAFATEMALHTGGSRGNALTQEGVNTAIRECLDVAQEIFPDAEITHVFGGNRDGNVDKVALSEEHLWQYDEEGKPVRSGSRRPDFGILVARSVVEMVRGNTFDSDGRGNPAGRESAARDDIGKKTEGEQMAMFEKQGKHMTAEEFQRNAREICREAMEKLRDDWEQRGELQKPPSKTWRDYPGPASARQAKELQDKRKPLP